MNKIFIVRWTSLSGSICDYHFTDQSSALRFWDSYKDTLSDHLLSSFLMLSILNSSSPSVIIRTLFDKNI